MNPSPFSFSPGDLVRIYTKVYEGDKQRIQPFEGIIIRKRGSGLNRTFTARKISFGIGVERTFPEASPVIDKIKVIKKGKVRRAKLYYIREKIGKKAKIEEAEAKKEPVSEKVTV